MIILLVAVIILASISLAYILDNKFEYTLPVVTSGLITLLYASGLFGARSIGVWLGLMMMSGIILYSGYSWRKTGRSIKPYINSPGLVFVLIFFVATLVSTHNFVYSQWDEFSHWGLVLKNMFFDNGFGNLPPTTILLQSYPPGIPLFISFFNQFNKVFSEANTLVGMLFVSAVQIMALYPPLKLNIKKDWRLFVVVSIIAVMIPTLFFPGFFGTIYVDALLGLICANILLFHYYYKKRFDWFYITYVSLQVFLLVNTKQIGIALSLLVLTVCTIHEISCRKQMHNSRLRHFILSAVPFVAAGLTYLSWKIFLAAHNISEAFQTSGGGFREIYSLATGWGDQLQYKRTTIVNFVQYIFSGQQAGMINMSYFMWFMFTGVVLYVSFRNRKNHKDAKQDSVFAIGMLSIVIIYAALILFMYIFAFTEYEAVRLASIERYMGTIFVAVAFVAVTFLLNNLISDNFFKKYRYLPFGLVLLGLVSLVNFASPLNDTLLSRYTNLARVDARVPTDGILRFGGIFDRKKDSVYIISQASSGADYWRIRYNLTPIRSSSGSWSIGKPYDAEDVWTTDLILTEWSNKLEDYTYVYLHHVDQNFINLYGDLFDSQIADQTLYRIVHPEGTLKLQKVKTEN